MWTQTTLGDATEMQYGYTATAQDQPVGPKLLRITDIVPDSIDWRKVPFCEISEHAFEQFALSKGDIVVARTGATAGFAKLIRDDVNAVFASYLIRIRPKSTDLDSEYLGRLIESNIFKRFVDQHKGGGAQPQANAPVLKTFQFRYPPVDVQSRIVSILSTYDDLIENNRRRILLLEEAARLVYQEWFVYLRFPGHEHVPVHDGVPQGWEEVQLRQLIKYINRGISPNYDDDGESMVINQKCIRDGKLNLRVARRQSKVFSFEKQIQLGDVLINSTGEGTLGRIAQVWTEIPKCTVDSHVTIARPAEDIERLWFGLTLLRMEDYVSKLGEGATNQTELKRHRVGEIEIMLPDRNSRQQFESLVTPLINQVTNLDAQNLQLNAARDLLLPRLMSGEIAV